MTKDVFFFGCIGEHPEGEAFLNWMDGDWLSWLQTVYYSSDNAETTQHLIAAVSEFGNTICGHPGDAYIYMQQ